MSHMERGSAQPCAIRLGQRSYAAIITLLLVSACAPAKTTNPMAEYFEGIKRAASPLDPKKMPTMVLTWDSDQPDLGQCRRVAGEPVVYLHMGKILESARSVQEAEDLIAEVLTHELGHARLTCSDDDHRILPKRSIAAEKSIVTRSYTWDLHQRKRGP